MIGCISLLIRPEAPKVTLYPVCPSCKVVPLDGSWRRFENECHTCTRSWDTCAYKLKAKERVEAAIERAYEANR